jgi:hypothetical protein
VSAIPSQGAKAAAGNGHIGAYPLPGGRHRIPRELLADNQRQHLIVGLAQALGEHGPRTTA